MTTSLASPDKDLPDNTFICRNILHCQFFECNSRHEISIEIIDNYLDLEGKERTILH